MDAKYAKPIGDGNHRLDALARGQIGGDRGELPISGVV
jgi:hypothetical protein